jgi:hypothetical protein
LQLPLLRSHVGLEHFQLARQTAESPAYVRQKGHSLLRNPGLLRLSPVCGRNRTVLSGGQCTVRHTRYLPQVRSTLKLKIGKLHVPPGG